MSPGPVLDRQPDLFGGAGYEVSARRDSILAARFGCPPFTVLDTRSGPWQARKQQWLALGIKSELGRSEALTYKDRRIGVEGLNFYRNREQEAAVPQPRSVDKYGAEDAYASTTRDGQPGHSRVPTTLAHITAGTAPEIAARFAQAGYTTSIFDPVLTELLYRWFVPPGGHILDPFCGGSVRGIVAACLGYAYTGVDLRPEQVATNEAQAAEIVPDGPPRWLAGDSREIAALAPGAYDGLLTCPPYGDLERYSDDPRDISTLGPAEFDAAYAEIMDAAAGLLAPDRFACVVVSNYRGRDGCYRDLVGLTHAALARAGCRLYNEAVLINPAGSLPVRVGLQFTAARKLGRSHQSVLVYVKGDWRKAARACAAGNTEEATA